MAAKKKPAAPAEQKARNSADVIVLGGGHNGLVAAAYLARAGMIGARGGQHSNLARLVVLNPIAQWR